MSTAKHTTLFPSYSDLEGTLKTQISLATSAAPAGEPDSNPERSTRLKRKRLESKTSMPKPKRLPLPINPPTSPRSLSVCHKASPWRDYHKMFDDEEAAPVTIAYKNLPNHHIVAVRTLKADKSWILGKLFSVDHRNVVTFIEAFSWDGKLSLVYQSIGVSLGDIVRCPYGPLREHEMATICKGVLDGIQFIQERLQCACPQLECDTILVSSDGDVKIGNIGEYLVKPEQKQNGPHELGCLLFELMEPGSASVDRKVHKLNSFLKWGDAIKGFLAATREEDLALLAKHTFLAMSPGPGCLKPYIEIARRSRKTNLQIALASIVEVTPLEHILLKVGKATSAMSQLPHQVEKAKRQPLPVAQNIQLIRDNSRLRQELKLYRERERSLIQLFHKCVNLQNQLAQATKAFSEAVYKHEEDMLEGFGVDAIDLAGVGDFRLI